MYNSSLKYKWDKKNVMDYAVETAEAKGLAKGEHKKAVEMARKMKMLGEPIDKIAVYTELSIEEIEALQI